jgi:hypothetical protein
MRVSVSILVQFLQAAALGDGQLAGGQRLFIIELLGNLMTCASTNVGQDFQLIELLLCSVNALREPGQSACAQLLS